VHVEPLNREWKERLLLSTRQPPEYFDRPEAVVDGPHAAAIRSALTDLGLSGVFCILGVPTVAILVMESYERDAVVNIHGALWNQGLASILLVISGDVVRVFSLARVPYAHIQEEFERRCLVETLNATTDALELKNLLYGAESGRLWTQHAQFFRPKERIDNVLLGNLIESHRTLCGAHLSADAAQALLIQTMFIAYLEDREIISEDYLRAALRRDIGTFAGLLRAGDETLLKRLFGSLRGDFNGDLFVTPCSFDEDRPGPQITASHMETLLRFRCGYEEMERGGQYRFWGYNFKFIPVELISAVYDRFLGEKDETRREQGAYYTPMFLADTVISQVWEAISGDAKEHGTFFDPACGSGMFLVRVFQRLCDHRRQLQGRASRGLRWDSLLAILSRLHGSDINGSAVRVAVFSLYIALLEEVSPPDIRRLIERGRLLPPLWNKALARQDFFTINPDTSRMDVVLGNPPWASRRGSAHRASIAWCRRNELPMPEREDAWAFTWKALQHLKSAGVLGLLVPAMSFLHNLAPSSCAARRLLIKKSRVLRIVNFSDLRFQLFDGAIRSTALLVCAGNATPETPYRFEYWTPHADVNLKTRRFITLTAADRKFLNSRNVEEDPLEFKHRLWMRGPDAKLFNYLSTFPKMSARIRAFASMRGSRNRLNDSWVIGYGFQPAGRGRVSKSPFVAKLPYLPIESLTPLAISTEGLVPWSSNKVFRHGFESAFHGVKILISRGVGTAAGRLRAAYTEESLTFRHIIQAISIPRGGERDAKLLTALLNSRVAVWYAFHGTASFGSERPEVQQRDLLRFPFPRPSELPDEGSATRAANSLIDIVDCAMRAANGRFQLSHDNQDGVLREVDRLAYEYFCLSRDEVLLIEDAVEHLIPAAQPSAGAFPEIWRQANEGERAQYIEVLLGSLRNWFDSSATIRARLEAHNADLAILRLTLNGDDKTVTYEEDNSGLVGESLQRLRQHLHQPLPGNFQLLPDFRVFADKYLYLVKPMQKRFWLRSSGLVDADEIALDLQETREVHAAQNGDR